MLTRPHRQVLATLALVLFTVVPTGYVALLAWRLNRPGHVRDVEVEVGRSLGLPVTIGQVRYPRPGQAVYRDVSLRLEEGRKGSRLTQVAHADELRLVRDGREWLAEADGLVLRADSPRGMLAQLAAVLPRAGGAACDRISLAARDCRVDLGDGLAYELRDVAVQFLPAGEGHGASLTSSYYFPTDGATTRCELALRRESLPDGLRTGLSFQTMDGPPLPAHVLDPFFDAAAWLGNAARVEGTLSLSQTGSSDWEAQFRGQLLDVDLAKLAGSRFPNGRLSGLARVSFERAYWAERPAGQGFGWVGARGTLTSERGTIGTPLLRALAAEMRFCLTPKADLRKADHEFRGLGLAFELGEDGGICLAGALGGEFPPGAVLVRGDRDTPLAFAPEGAASVRGLWKTLFPPTDDVVVPVGAETHMLNSLPLPVAAPRDKTPVRAN